MGQMVTTRKRQKEIVWVDPLDLKRQTLLGEDYRVHKVSDTSYTQHGVAYKTKCGLIFTFFTYGQAVLEAKIKQPKPTCPECLSLR